MAIKPTGSSIAQNLNLNDLNKQKTATASADESGGGKKSKGWGIWIRDSYKKTAFQDQIDANRKEEMNG